MKKKILFSLKSPYREQLDIIGFRFGHGKKSLAIVGAMRGNEVQQMYVCSRMVQALKRLESEGKIAEDSEILVVPCINYYSMNIGKRFWAMDNTDINRMFPGYDLGETTQRIADGVFKEIKEHEYGIQFASFYMPGNFVPQVRMMKTGREKVELAKKFGLPYVVLHNPRPFDTTTLNYNWQLWDTNAFSLYTTSTGAIDKESADQAVSAILNFMSKQDIIDYQGYEGYISRVVESKDMLNIRAEKAGFFMGEIKAGQRVQKGDVLARIVAPYTGEVKQMIIGASFKAQHIGIA